MAEIRCFVAVVFRAQLLRKRTLYAWVERSRMKSLIAVISVLVPAVCAPANARPFRVVCVGMHIANGYPFGVRNLGETTFTVSDEGKQTVISDDRGGDFCPKGANCTVVAIGDDVQVEAKNIPKADPIYSQRFTINPKSLTFQADGGGLDGGWSTEGSCKPERP
jgi:hypothetical protein